MWRKVIICVIGVSAVLGLFPVAYAGALPAERHYEMVSPSYKGGYGVFRIGAVAASGDAVAYASFGIFDGAPSGADTLDYLARRNAGVWQTVPLMPPTNVLTDELSYDISPNLNLAFDNGKLGPNSQTENPAESFVLHNTETADTPENWELGGSFTAVNGEITLAPYEGASAAFCHVFYIAPTGEALVEPIFKEAANDASMLYDYNRGCEGGTKALSAIGVNNKGTALRAGCSTGPGDQFYEPQGTAGKDVYNATSTDGEQVFFTSCVSGEGTETELPHQLFVRLGKVRTIEVSRPLTVPCVEGGVSGEVPCEDAASRQSANFAGASEDGTLVYFMTRASLTESDTDSGNDLYMARIGCGTANPDCSASEREVISLIQVSHGAQTANVQGVVRISPDGSHVYYVAQGDLLNSFQRKQLESEKRPVPHVGAENLYMYDERSDATEFIGDLCSETRLSGSVEDVACPGTQGDSRLWNMSPASTMAQTAGQDGEFLVFATYAQLTAEDTNEALDVYRFDAATGRLLRVSGGEDGYDSNGNHTVLSRGGEPLGAEIQPPHIEGTLLSRYDLAYRAVSENGSRIVFSSEAPLSPLAGNGLSNIYEWHEAPGGSGGSISIISGGSSTQPVSYYEISPDGTNIYFVTTDSLVAQDSDSLPDLYDARLGAGFPAAPVVGPRPCEGDACQGALTVPAPVILPGSYTQIAEGNLRPTVHVGKSKKKVVPKRHNHVRRRRKTKVGGKKKTARSPGGSAGASDRGGRR